MANSFSETDGRKENRKLYFSMNIEINYVIMITLKKKKNVSREASFHADQDTKYAGK